MIIEKLWASQHRKAVERFLSTHWPSLSRRHPEASLVVVGGKGMPASFWRLIEGMPRVSLHEWVEDLEDLLAGVGIAVFPYSVEVGMKNRVMQCLGAGNAVVGTNSAFSGIPVRNGVEAMVSNSHGEIAAAVDRLLADPDLCGQIGDRARLFIKARFDEEVMGRAWEDFFCDVADGRAPRRSYGVPDDAAHQGVVS